MEALGAASSVIGVISLAVQLSTAVQQLIDFWASVKDAPAESNRIKIELAVLASLLRGIEAGSHGALDGPDISQDCLAICKDSIATLQELSARLDKGLNGNGIRRKWTCLKKALREKELATYWSMLERAKTTLVIYQGLRNR